MIIKIRFALAVASLLSSVALASPVLAASRHDASSGQGYTNGYSTQEWERGAPHAFVGGA